jgi:hypothetical protein
MHGEIAKAGLRLRGWPSLRCAEEKEPPCDALAYEAASEVRDSVDAAERSCADDGQCVLGKYYPICVDGCGSTAATSSTAVAELKAAVEGANDTHCAAFFEESCVKIAVPCNIGGAPPRFAETVSVKWSTARAVAHSSLECPPRGPLSSPHIPVWK